MKSLERRFNNIAAKHPAWSSYICFAQAVKGQNFTRPVLHYWFNRLVEKHDYSHSEKKDVMAHIEKLNRPVDGHTK